MIEFLNFNKELEIIAPSFLKILIATICGFIIGYEREKKNKVAGIRTNILICVGSAIFTICSLILSDLYQTDPSRILSTIVTGIGFLGGGAIVKNDDKIIGMTTAAFIWVGSAIGMLSGLGFILIPILMTIGLVIVVKLFEKVEKTMKDNNSNKK